MNVLHIDSGILGDHSVSRRLTAALAAQVKADRPDAQVTYRDLAASSLPHLTGAQIMAPADLEGVDAGLAADVKLGRDMLEEFLAADTVIIGAPMYNFGIPSQRRPGSIASPSPARLSATPRMVRKALPRARRLSSPPPAAATTPPARRPSWITRNLT